MITLKGLDFTRSRNWLKKAEDARKHDSIGAFVFAWISFNHYYSTFMFENIARFNNWTQQYNKGRQGDKAELLFLVHSQEFIDVFADFKQKHPQHLNLSIDLPVINMLRGSHVPENIKGEKRLSDLTPVDLFMVIYQIRNNLFHGSKDPVKNQRDLVLCSTATGFMVPIVAFLLTNTYGEVLNAYDNSAQDLREQIRKLAEA